MIILFVAVPTGNGNISFDMLGGTFIQDCKTFRAQGRKLTLSVGGSTGPFGLNSRQESDNFITSFSKIYDKLGGLDGLDWNNFEGSQTPTTSEMIYVSQQLKSKYGQSFTISCPPAPWRQIDKDFAVAMKNAGVLDFAAPQFYDGSGLNTQSGVMNHLASWVPLLGQEKVVVGFGVSNAANYWSAQSAADCLRSVLQKYPNIGGIFDWEVNYDNANGNPFSSQVAPILGTP
jgi:chitinase